MRRERSWSAVANTPVILLFRLWGIIVGVQCLALLTSCSPFGSNRKCGPGGNGDRVYISHSEQVAIPPASTAESFDEPTVRFAAPGCSHILRFVGHQYVFQIRIITTDSKNNDASGNVIQELHQCDEMYYFDAFPLIVEEEVVLRRPA